MFKTIGELVMRGMAFFRVRWGRGIYFRAFLYLTKRYSICKCHKFSKVNTACLVTNAIEFRTIMKLAYLENMSEELTGHGQNELVSLYPLPIFTG